MSLKQTFLHNTHIAQNAKMLGFAGYNMPIQYPLGVLKEHEWVRQSAGVFDVSHMGQAIVQGQGAREYFNKLTPSTFLKTPAGKAKYTVLSNEQGGIIDDLIITCLSDDKFFVVFNAGNKDTDIAWFKQHLPASLTFTELSDKSLIALQGQKAEQVLQKFTDTDLSNLGYMCSTEAKINNSPVYISRLGYTGEDGFEISISNDKVIEFWQNLCADEAVEPIGLAARDSLRLEMGYPLHGHDIDATTTPIEADLNWIVSKTNNAYFGYDIISNQKQNGASKKRVGIKLTERGIAREGSNIYSQDGKLIGKLTSGSFSPTLQASIGQGYVDINYAVINTPVAVEVRSKKIPATVQDFTFVQPKTKR